jgi:hypothetical protein
LLARSVFPPLLLEGKKSSQQLTNQQPPERRRSAPPTLTLPASVAAAIRADSSTAVVPRPRAAGDPVSERASSCSSASRCAQGPRAQNLANGIIAPHARLSKGGLHDNWRSMGDGVVPRAPAPAAEASAPLRSSTITRSSINGSIDLSSALAAGSSDDKDQVAAPTRQPPAHRPLRERARAPAEQTAGKTAGLGGRLRRQGKTKGLHPPFLLHLDLTKCSSPLALRRAPYEPNPRSTG